MWQKPSCGVTKCNVAASWVDPNKNSGAAWIVRDHFGIPLSHSRQAASPTFTSFEAELNSLLWASEAMHDLRFKRVILEIVSLTVESHQ